MSEVMDRLHRVVLQVGVEIWPTWKAAKAQPGAKTPPPASAQWARQMRDFEETMKPAYDLLLPDASVIQELERTNHIMTSELWLLNRMLYKNKNQHAHAHYWRHLVHVKKVMTKLMEVQLPLLHQRFPFSPPSTAPTDTPKGGKKVVRPHHVPPTKVELECVLYWLLAVAVYTNEVLSVIERGSLDMMSLLEQTFFMPFALTALGVLSRFYALCKFVLVQLDCLYGALHRALEFYPEKELDVATLDHASRQHVVDQFAGLLGSLPVLLEQRLKESETAQSVALERVMKQMAATYTEASQPLALPASASSSSTTTTTTTSSAAAVGASATTSTPASSTPSSTSRKRKAAAILPSPAAAGPPLLVPIASTPTPTPKAKAKAKATAAMPSAQAPGESAFKYREVGARAKKRRTGESATTTTTTATAATPSPASSSSSSSTTASSSTPATPAPALKAASMKQTKAATPPPQDNKPTTTTTTTTTPKGKATKSAVSMSAAAAAPVAKAGATNKAKPSESLDDIMAALLPGKKTKKPAATPTAVMTTEAAATPTPAVKEEASPAAKKPKPKTKKASAGSLDDIFASLMPSSSSSSGNKKTPTKKRKPTHQGL